MLIPFFAVVPPFKRRFNVFLGTSYCLTALQSESFPLASFQACIACTSRSSLGNSGMSISGRMEDSSGAGFVIGSVIVIGVILTINVEFSSRCG